MRGGVPRRVSTGVAVGVLVLMLAGWGGTGATGPVAGASAMPAGATATRAFRGLGTWVDVYDYGPKFQSRDGALPAVTPASVDDMARLGVRTLYLQAAQDDTRSEGTIVDRRLVGAILRRAHSRGVKVVAWYLPHFADIGRDMRYVDAMYRFRTHGERFDGIALDLEWTSDVKDPADRNRALVALSGRARRAVTEVPLGAIVLDPVLLQDVNPAYWPAFPWKRIRSSFDVWMPMAYWTNRTAASGWRDGFRYAAENVRRLRSDLGERNAVVSVIGGIADQASPGDIAGFVRAAKQRGSIGWSLYDYVTTSSSAWTRLRG
jgi:hypothetical protein